MMVRAVVSLGSNVGDRAAHLKRAIELLSGLPETRLLKVSSVIETEPVGVPEEFAGMKFLNQAAVFETDLAPRDFSDRMHSIEEIMGRVRTVRNGPRTIDIDLIDFGGIEMDDPELMLPHPRAKERDFVLVPLAEIGVRLK
jgi:2-amino-4-hydroxy-6-hydroxymethyldihydropteridine diphosphokinase